MSDARFISVVDDDASVRGALDSLLRSGGLSVALFASAEEFLPSPARGKTGCLILDLRMPGMNGLELQQRLATSGERIPIIILTAHDDEEARTRALGAGAVAFLQKPFDAKTLLGAVEAGLRRP
jgi:FixJ family two-component response regulator